MLLKEMQSLALDVDVLSEEGAEVEVREEEDELLRAAEELGIDLSPGSLRAAAREPTAEEVEEGAERVDEEGELALPTDEVARRPLIRPVSDGEEADEEAQDQAGRAGRRSGTRGIRENKGRDASLIDINEFDAIRIGLASTKQIRDWS